MNSAERMEKALNHQEPDRVPLDLGGIVSGITLKAHLNLKEYLGIEEKDYIIDKTQQLAKPSNRILEEFGIDTRYVFINCEEHQPDKQEEYFIDEWQVKRKRSENYAGGVYYDIVASPLEDKTLADLKKEDWVPVVADVESVINKTKKVAQENEDKTIILNYMGATFEHAWYLRGFEKLLMELHQDPDVINYIIDKIVDHRKSFYNQVLPQIDPLVDILMVGDDLGTQIGPLISPDIYRKLIKPKQIDLYKHIKDKADVKLFYHTCGDCLEFVPDLIEAGIDILNPIQVSSLDPQQLKKEFGKDLVFWGGIDTHEVLPFGNTEDVEEEVKKRIDQLAPGGGFVLNSVHNIQADVPPENVVAMFKTALEYGKY